MKKFFYTVIAILALTSCHKAIWDKLNDHERRIQQLELFCNQMNTNINSLQAIVDAINARDYVKDVLPITENGTIIGYTITFNSRNPINIYNGKNGEDAHTPIIGIKKDADNVYYWTLDGEWILDQDGNKVRAEGITPLLKIQDEYWWISYDNAATWEKLGKATGEPGSNGTNGDSMFSDIYQDEHSVYLVLADGEIIQLSKGGLTWVYV